MIDKTEFYDYFYKPFKKQKLMKKNVGSTDRIIRIIIGLAIGAVGYYYQSWWGLLGLIPLLTGLINFCPLYVPFNINTGKKAE
jgi:hypothetical protein